MQKRDIFLICNCEGTALYQDLCDRLFAAPGTWALLRCPKRGLVWLNPQPIPEDIDKLYSEYYTHDTATETPKEPTKSWRETVKFSILNSAFGYRSDGGANKTLGWLTSLPSWSLAGYCRRGCNVAKRFTSRQAP